MRWGLLVTLCACNQVFGLQSTKRIDAAYYDAPIDAPFMCPPLSTTPYFETKPQQAIYETCNSYQEAADGSFAMAVCLGHISQGPVGGPMTAVDDLASDTSSSRQNAWLAPEGDQAYIAETGMTSVTTWVRYGHAGDVHWTRGDTLIWPSPIATNVYDVSTPSRGPARHLMALDNGGYLDELIDDGTPNLVFVRRYGQGELGVYNYSGPALSPDGLRMVIYATQPDAATGMIKQAIWYSDRPSIDAPFRPFEMILGVYVTDPWLRGDCGRLYFSGIGSIWYVQQR